MSKALDAATAATALSQYREPGTFLFAWGSRGSQFDPPTDVCIYHERVYVTDSCNSRACVFNMLGQFLFEWGKRGTDPGQFHFPYGICQLDELIYVNDSGNNRVQVVFNEMGEFIREWGEYGKGNGQFWMPRSICAISTDHRQVFVVDSNNWRVQIYDPHGKFIRILDPDHLEQPSAIICNNNRIFCG